MGLTIHYSLEAQGDQARARTLVNALHQTAQDLPFTEVGEIFELSADECDQSKRDREDPLRWLLIQAEAKVELKQSQQDSDDQAGIQHHRIRPLHLIAFGAWPGEGCEESNFGLCQYPAAIDTKAGRLNTGLTGWHWSSFCKTQYSSDPSCGGVSNFLQCHLSVIAMLDKAKELGCLAHVNDEGGFWEGGDLQGLVEKVGSWNEMLAVFAGRLRELAGGSSGSVESAITKYPNFEQLEAAGQKQLPPQFEKLTGLIARVCRFAR